MNETCFRVFEITLDNKVFCGLILGGVGLVFIALFVPIIVLACLRCKLLKKLAKFEFQYNQYSQVGFEELKSAASEQDSKHLSSASVRLDEPNKIVANKHANEDVSVENGQCKTAKKSSNDEVKMVYSKSKRNGAKILDKNSENIPLSQKQTSKVEDDKQQAINSNVEGIYDEITEEIEDKARQESEIVCKVGGVDEEQLDNSDHGYVTTADLAPSANDGEEADLDDENTACYDRLFKNNQSRKKSSDLNYDVVDLSRMSSKFVNKERNKGNKRDSDDKNSAFENSLDKTKSSYRTVKKNFNGINTHGSYSEDEEDDETDDQSSTDGNDALSHLSLPPPPLPPPYQESADNEDENQKTIYDFAVDS